MHALLLLLLLMQQGERVLLHVYLTTHFCRHACRPGGAVHCSCGLHWLCRKAGQLQLLRVVARKTHIAGIGLGLAHDSDIQRLVVPGLESAHSIMCRLSG